MNAHSRHQGLNVESIAISSTKQKSSFASAFNYYIPNTHQCQYEIDKMEFNISNFTIEDHWFVIPIPKRWPCVSTL